MADRAAWRQILRWPDGCEDAFQASHASDDGGLLFETLDEGVLLVQVVCALGAYQPASVWLTVRPSNTGDAMVSVLAFPVEPAERPDTSVAHRETEIFGEWTFDRSSGQLTLLSVARQTGDCGFWARYVVRADAVRQTEFASKSPCPSRPGPHATLDATHPPPNWTHHILE
jgi:hypothetical protein